MTTAPLWNATDEDDTEYCEDCGHPLLDNFYCPSCHIGWVDEIYACAGCGAIGDTMLCDRCQAGLQETVKPTVVLVSRDGIYIHVNAA